MEISAPTGGASGYLQSHLASGRKGGEGEACRWWWVKGEAKTLLSNTLHMSDPLSKSPHDGDGGGGMLIFLDLSVDPHGLKQPNAYSCNFGLFGSFWLFLKKNYLVTYFMVFLEGCKRYLCSKIFWILVLKKFQNYTLISMPRDDYILKIIRKK